MGQTRRPSLSRNRFIFLTIIKRYASGRGRRRRCGLAPGFNRFFFSFGGGLDLLLLRLELSLGGVFLGVDSGSGSVVGSSNPVAGSLGRLIDGFLLIIELLLDLVRALFDGLLFRVVAADQRGGRDRYDKHIFHMQ